MWCVLKDALFEQVQDLSWSAPERSAADSSRAECRKPLKEREASRRAATTGERCSLVTLSAERCLGGPSRSHHGEGNRQHSKPEWVLDLLGVSDGGTLGQSNAEQERSYLAAKSGKDRAYRAGWLKSRGRTRRREGALLWSRRRGGNREGMPETANNSAVKARQRRLLASLADGGQQTPIVVVASEGQADRYVVIDGYKRIAALEQLGRDTV